MDDEGSFAAGRQALLDALQSLVQRAHDRSERILRDAERAARQLTLDSVQRAYWLTTEAEERARQTLFDAEQRAKQVTLETGSRLAELEQELAEVRDQLEAARAQIEEQVVSVRGQVEVARASLNTIRQQLTSGAPRPSDGSRAADQSRPTADGAAARARAFTGSRRSPGEPAHRGREVAPSLNDLRAAVDALKRPQRMVPAINESNSSSESLAADRALDEEL